MSLIPFLLFAFVASITPGPTNILVLTNSQHFGVKKIPYQLFWAGVSRPVRLCWYQALARGKCCVSTL